MFGINSFYYTEIVKYKRSIRNTLLLYLRSEDEEGVLTTIDQLAPLFLVDHDNIDKPFYTAEEMELVSAVLNAYFAGEETTVTLQKADAEKYIDLAMNKRLTLEQNETLAMRLAKHYNDTCSNELLLMDMNVFAQVCRSIDDPQ